MPHVEEGQLHALLDGAYAHDSQEARDLRTHLDECAHCRAQLAEATALRDRAASVLHAARPRSEEMPPFELLLQRAAEQKTQPRRIATPYRLAWAASIVLALGVGWFGSDMARPRAALVNESDAASTAPEAAPSLPVAADQVQQGGPARDGQARGIVAEPESGLRDRERQAAASGSALQRQAAVEGAIGGRTIAPAVPLPQPSAPPPALARGATVSQKVAAANTAVRLSRDSTARRAEAVVAASPPPGTPPPPPPARPMPSEAVVTGAGTFAWSMVTLADAQRIANRPVLLMPGLDVVNVWIGSKLTGVVVRITQQLPDQNVVELTQEPLVVAPAAQAAANLAERRDAMVADETARIDETGAWLVTVRKGNLTLTGRALLPRDSLRALLNRAR
jgi:hypothetical protein